MIELPVDIEPVVAMALQEDIGPGDVTAALVPEDEIALATIITREDAVLCGTAWVNEVYRQLAPDIRIHWQVTDGDPVTADQTVCELTGKARVLLTGERTALNFLQCLSGTATVTRHYADLISDTGCRILDTRKTIPCLRTAQKYAVACGGGVNHRMGLYDAVLIKENHVIAAGGIESAVQMARQISDRVQVEVESLAELEQAIDAGANAILLDNFAIADMGKAVRLNKGRATLEASGGVDEAMLRDIADTGVDFVSIGALTKHVRAVDYSMRFQVPGV